MKVAISGHVFNTDKAKWHASLDHFDGHNQIYGDIYQSRNGIFYILHPFKWGNNHRWEIITPKRILEDYGVDEYLTEEEIDYIVQEGNVEVERWKNR